MISRSKFVIVRCFYPRVFVGMVEGGCRRFQIYCLHLLFVRSYSDKNYANARCSLLV